MEGTRRVITLDDINAFQYYNQDPLEMDKYQQQAATTAIYDQKHAIIYPALGLAAEAGEVANKVKKIMRDGNLDREGLSSEIGDCLWYIAALCRDLNIDMETVAYDNLEKLHGRQKRGTLRGNGDKR